MRKLFALTIKKISVLFGGRPLLFPITLAVLALLFYTVGAVNGAERRSEACITMIDEQKSNYSAALVDAITNTDGFSVRLADSEDEALADIADGRSEAILTLPNGFDERLTGDDADGIVDLRMAPGSAVQDLIRETVSGRLLALRACVRAKGRIEADGLSTEEFEKLYASFEAPKLYSVSAIGGGKAADRAVFGQGFPGYAGFTALAMMLIMLTVTRKYSEASSRLAAKRMHVLDGGRVLRFSTDALACFVVSLAMGLVSFALTPDRSFSYAAAAAAYALELTGLTLLTSRIVGAGRIDVASPFIALVTSIFGGCFADTASLSPALRVISKVTPQGRFIAAASGSYLFVALMVVIGLALSACAFAFDSKDRS